MDDGCEEYIRKVLEAYRKTPGTIGTVRRADRMLAAQLHQRGVCVSVMRIPVNWSTDSGGSGPASESLTQV